MKNEELIGPNEDDSQTLLDLGRWALAHACYATVIVALVVNIG